MKAGDVFGRLTILSVGTGAKNVHARAWCECSCGGWREARHTDLRRGLVNCCASCAHKRGHLGRPKNSARTVKIRDRESQYKMNAKTKGRVWGLSRELFAALFEQACRYCGAQPSEGVDRVDNGRGYTPDNSAPCCSACNFAKRDMSAPAFVALAKRIAAHAG